MAQRGTILENPLKAAVLRLEAGFEMVPVLYPVEIWVPRETRAQFRQDWPLRILNQQPLCLRLPPLQERTDHWVLKLDHVEATMVVDANEIILDLQKRDDLLPNPIHLIPEARLVI